MDENVPQRAKMDLVTGLMTCAPNSCAVRPSGVRCRCTLASHAYSILNVERIEFEIETEMQDLPSLVLFFIAMASPNAGLPLTPATLRVAAQSPEVMSQFARLDADGDGYVTRAEARNDAEILRTFRRADANKDGRLDRTEFAAAQLLSRIERPAQYVHAKSPVVAER